VDEPNGRLSSWDNHLEDQKLGRDEGNVEGIIWSGEGIMDHKESVVGSQS